MKKFFFSLNTVLNYKEQVLESLRGEHVAALLKVRACEREIEALENQHKDCMEEFECQKRTGIAISKMKTYEGYLESLGVRILRKQEHLADLKENEIKKRTRMIEAKKEFTSIQKLKEKKQEEYRKQEQKENETLIEEFVSSRTAVSKLNG